jgi:hypothetical protein
MAGELRQAEVDDLERAVWGQQDVCRFQVAVCDAGHVGSGHAPGDLDRAVEGAVDTQAAGPNGFVEVRPLHIFHCDELDVVCVSMS